MEPRKTITPDEFIKKLLKPYRGNLETAITDKRNPSIVYLGSTALGRTNQDLSFPEEIREREIERRLKG